MFREYRRPPSSDQVGRDGDIRLGGVEAVYRLERALAAASRSPTRPTHGGSRRNYRKQRKALSEIEFFGVVGGIVMVAIGVCMIRFADYLLDNVDRLRIAFFGTRLVALLPSVRTPRAGGVGFILGGVALSVIAAVSAIRGL
jgi:hypothetical protein